MSKIYKYLLFTVIVSSISGTIIYNLLSNRHQAILKTHFLHLFHIVDNNWENENVKTTFKTNSPSFLIDGIYKSMEGPKATQTVRLNNTNDLLFITDFSVKAIDAKTQKEISKEFICHTNIDINPVSYFSGLKLENRIGNQYPRMVSLSSGFEDLQFPNGYGIPVIANEPLTLITQSLNHNIKDIRKEVKHHIVLKHENYNGQLKPLLSKTVFIQLPYNKYNPFKSPLDPSTNQCIPVETKNHSYANSEGEMFSGHWVIPVGKNTYRSSIDEQLQIKDSLRLHYAAIHVHPFATSISLFDSTANETLFTSTIENLNNKIGLVKVMPFSSEEGIWLYGNHSYELILEVNNTSAAQQDMMGSMFLFFYDKELDENLKLNSLF